MEPNKDTPSSKDLIHVITALYFWGSESFQAFLESGLAHDFAESVRSKSFNLDVVSSKLIPHGENGYNQRNDVSLSQTAKILSIAPHDNFLNWCYFFKLIETIGRHSLFFNKYHINWEDRDLWRCQTLGLNRISPVYQNEQGQDIVFRRAGHCSVWGCPEDGYRYAKPEEVPLKAFKDLDLIAVHMNKYGWARIWIIGDDVRPTNAGVVAHDFFHNNVFYVPLVKI